MHSLWPLTDAVIDLDFTPASITYWDHGTHHAKLESEPWSSGSPVQSALCSAVSSKQLLIQT